MSPRRRRLLAGAVLTGGASSRFGSDKATTPLGTSGSVELLGGQSVAALRDAGIDPVVAVGGTAGHTLAVPVIGDRSPGLGPLSGIASVLVWAKQGHVLVLPCDLPLVTGALLLPFLEWLEDADPKRAGVASVMGRPEPIVAAWPAHRGAAFAASIRSGNRRLFGALDLVDWDPVEVAPALLADADTPADLARLLGADPFNQ